MAQRNLLSSSINYESTMDPEAFINLILDKSEQQQIEIHNLREQLKDNEETIEKLQNENLKLSQDLEEIKSKHLNLSSSSANSFAHPASQNMDRLSLQEEAINEIAYAQAITFAEREREHRQSIDKTKSEHEDVLSFLISNYEEELWNLKSSNEQLTQDFFAGCEGLFVDIKADFLRDVERNPNIKTASGHTIFVDFKGMTENKRGILVTAISIISNAFGNWVSWEFIVWGWSKLTALADVIIGNGTRVAKWLRVIYQFIRSPAFQSFMRAWEDGRSLQDCVQEFTGSPRILSSMLQMAPQVFAAIKSI